MMMINAFRCKSFKLGLMLALIPSSVVLNKTAIPLAIYELARLRLTYLGKRFRGIEIQ